jgi:DNA-binding response OmpR family regulator
MAGSDPVVLIVEDEPDVAETYRLCLEGRYDVRVAHDGDEGLALLDDEVDVVLLDRMMPGLSGDEMLERTRQEGIGCRVAMVTAVEPDFDILEMGFDAYLSKPVEGRTLRETVDNLLERSEYDSLLQEYYALVEKQATLEATKRASELDGSEEYDRLQDDIARLRAELSETLGGVEDDADFIATVREIGDDDEH